MLSLPMNKKILQTLWYEILSNAESQWRGLETDNEFWAWISAIRYNEK